MVKYTGIKSKENSLLTMNIPLEICQETEMGEHKMEYKAYHYRRTRQYKLPEHVRLNQVNIRWFFFGCVVAETHDQTPPTRSA